MKKGLTLKAPFPCYRPAGFALAVCGSHWAESPKTGVSDGIAQILFPLKVD